MSSRLCLSLLAPGTTMRPSWRRHLLRKSNRRRQPTDALLFEEQLVSEIIARSFPNLIGLDIRVKRFQSHTDYFRTSFSAPRFIAGVKMRYVVWVNLEWRNRGAPVEGVQAILAHELAHVEDLAKGKRLRSSAWWAWCPRPGPLV